MSDNKTIIPKSERLTKIIIKKEYYEENERRLPVLPSRYTEDTDIS